MKTVKSHNLSHILPVLHSFNTQFNSIHNYTTLILLYSYTLTLLHSYILPILHSSNLTLFQFLTLPIDVFDCVLLCCVMLFGWSGEFCQVNIYPWSWSQWAISGLSLFSIQICKSQLCVELQAVCTLQHHFVTPIICGAVLSLWSMFP